jgi:hypothetical protein
MIGRQLGALSKQRMPMKGMEGQRVCVTPVRGS